MNSTTITKTYREVVDLIRDFATDRGLVDLKRGQGARVMITTTTPPKVTNTNTKPKGVCYYYADGNCKKGKECRFKHEGGGDGGGDTTSNTTKKKPGKGECWNCVSKEHLRAACKEPKKEKPEEKEGQEGQVAQYMIRVRSPESSEFDIKAGYAKEHLVPTCYTCLT